MRSSVIAVSSANARLSTAGRNMRIDGRESELYHSSAATALDTRPFKGPLRALRSQNHEGFTRPTQLRIIGQKNIAEQIPFPRSVSPLDVTSENPPVSTCSSREAPRRCLTNDTDDGAGVAPQEGVFNRCFTFMKHVGAKLMMPPYTIDGELDHVARKHGYVNLDVIVTKFPLI